jgi:FKBP-type peptidyl-prolyl cis-trans isomerase FkpA
MPNTRMAGHPYARTPRALLLLLTLTLALAACGAAPLPAEYGRIEGLQIEEIVEGQGEGARAGERLRMHYRGYLFDQRADAGRGPKFDDSQARGRPFEFVLGAGQVIRGWDEGLLGLKPGGQRRLLIGPELGYGERGAGSAIPPGASLVFEVERLAESP